MHPAIGIARGWHRETCRLHGCGTDPVRQVGATFRRPASSRKNVRLYCVPARDAEGTKGPSPSRFSGRKNARLACPAALASADVERPPWPLKTGKYLWSQLAVLALHRVRRRLGDFFRGTEVPDRGPPMRHIRGHERIRATNTFRWDNLLFAPHSLRQDSLADD